MSTPNAPTVGAHQGSAQPREAASAATLGSAQPKTYNDAPAGQRLHAFRDDALGELDAVGIAEAVANKQISAREAVAAAVERARAVDPVINAVEYWDDVRALDRAGRVDAGLLGNHHERHGAALRGVPSAFKDNVLVGNLAMTQGSAALPRKAGRRNGKVVQQIMGTGVLPIATTTMPPFGWTATTERPGGNVTRNPWDTNRSSGGSSGGSAALVAAGVIPIAHGNDGGGSIRIPAAACGLVGLKPTRGRLVLGESSAQLPVKVVSDSVMTRTVRDTIAFFEEAQRVRPARRLAPIEVSTDPQIGRSLSVGVLMDSPFAPPTDAETRAAVENTASLLEGLGHGVAPFNPKIPDFFQQDFIDYWGFLAFNTVSTGKRLFHPEFDASKLDPFTLGLAKLGKRRLHHAPKYLARLQTSQVAYRRQLASGPDIVISPVLAHVTPAIGWLDGDLDFETHLARVLDYCSFTPLHNATGAPAISLPLGRTASGLPIGVMISGAHGAESLLLKVALQLEEAQPFARIQD